MNIDSPEERTVLHYQLHRQVDLSYYLSGKNNATKRILYIVNVSNFSKKKCQRGIYLGTMYFREKKILLMGRLLVYCCVVN